MLGRSEIAVSAIGFGCGSVGGLFVRGSPAEQRAAVLSALEGGITYFDTAAAYGDGASEENLGRTLRELRADPIVGTKVRLAPDEAADSNQIVRERLEAGLTRLGRDRVDLCTLHGWIGGDGQLSAGQVCGPVASALRGLVEAGLCRAIGFTGQGEVAALEEVLAAGAFDYFQCIYSLANPSAGARRGHFDLTPDYGDLLAGASASGSGVMAIRALAAGALSEPGSRHPLAGRLLRGPDAVFAAAIEAQAESTISRLRAEMATLGVPDVAELAIRFALGEERLSTVLVGFSDTSQVEAALRAERAPRLTSEQFGRLIDLSHPTTSQ